MELIFEIFEDPMTLLKIKISKNIKSLIQWHFICWHIDIRMRFLENIIFEINK